MGRKARQGKRSRATESRMKWRERVNKQNHLGTREAREEANVCMLDKTPRNSRRRGRADTAALVSSKSHPFRRKGKTETQRGCIVFCYNACLESKTRVLERNWCMCDVRAGKNWTHDQ